jgi:hypothetical protein
MIRTTDPHGVENSTTKRDVTEMKSLAMARLKRVRALELASGGCPYDQIAIEVGFSHRGSAHRAVWKALNEREAEGADQLRERGLARLEMLLTSVWNQALAGDPAAGAQALRILQEQSKLYGLYARTMDTGGSSSGPRSMFIDDWSSREA